MCFSHVQLSPNETRASTSSRLAEADTSILQRVPDNPRARDFRWSLVRWLSENICEKVMWSTCVFDVFWARSALHLFICWFSTSVGIAFPKCRCGHFRALPIDCGGLILSSWPNMTFRTNHLFMVRQYTILGAPWSFQPHLIDGSS